MCQAVSLRLLAAAAALVTATVLPAPAAADFRDCERAINSAAAKFVRLEYKALRTCNDAVVRGTRPGPCPDVRANGRLASAVAKLHAKIARSCGGADMQCGGGDDVPLASIGWNIGTCPNLSNGGCTNAIGDCDDVADCVACIGAAAVAHEIALTYDDLNSASPPPNVVACQRRIGKSTEKFAGVTTKALQKCEDRVLLAYSNGPCPDAIADLAIAKAEAKKVKSICKFCGGSDQQCGTADDLTPAMIGFAADCPDVTVPGGASCAAPITSLQGIVDCVDCVAAFDTSCASAAAVPAAMSYPAECNSAATATPTTTATTTPVAPTASATPTVTLPLPTVTLPVATPTVLPSVTLPLPTVTLPLATVTLPVATPTVVLPSVTLPLPTVTLPLATVTLPVATPTVVLPTVTLPVPTITVPLPTVTLPLPTLTLPLATATATVGPPTATPTRTPTPTPTATPFCGNGVIEAGEVCELPALGCPTLQICLLCQQCVL